MSIYIFSHLLSPVCKSHFLHEANAKERRKDGRAVKKNLITVVTIEC